ncbi:hypothetical protein J6590_010192 [Homalodisca vitripennis]|nr:hypothetical protein J6590_010192 [Homalodisca vitripennis]
MSGSHVYKKPDVAGEGGRAGGLAGWRTAGEYNMHHPLWKRSTVDAETKYFN